jgi:hypothetical protein
MDPADEIAQTLNKTTLQGAVGFIAKGGTRRAAAPVASSI